MRPATIARLLVTLADVEPKVMRRLEVPADIRLDRLHLTLQAAFGWTNSHLWEIRAREARWGIPDPGWPDGPLDAKKTTLWNVVEDTAAKTLRYTYDFGDCWEHVIKITAFDDADPFEKYPALIDAVGRCPPEDVGGPPGYEEGLAAVADPKHERHEELIDWWPEDFDPAIAPVEDLMAAVADLAKRWSRKPRAKKTA
jgi:hypothetical protein